MRDEIPGLPCDNGAVMDGYTQMTEGDRYLLVKPDTDLGSTFKAWDTDLQEWVVVDGSKETIRPYKMDEQ